MQLYRNILYLSAGFIFLVNAGCEDDEKPGPVAIIQLSAVRVGTYTLDINDFSKNDKAPVDRAVLISFSSPLDAGTVPSAVSLREKSTDTPVMLAYSFLDNNKTISAQPDQELSSNVTYELLLSDNLAGADGETFSGHTIEFTTEQAKLEIVSLKVNATEVLQEAMIDDVAVEALNIEITFSHPLDPADVKTDFFRIIGGGSSVPLTLTVAQSGTQVTMTVDQILVAYERYQLWVSDQVSGAEGQPFLQYNEYFYTGAGTEPAFPQIPDEELLTKVQQQTFSYFWDFAETASGMARERNTSGNLVTSGGSGFGVMALIVGIERGFITRAEGIDRMDRILDFLETADRFHGAWSHWINGTSGAVIPFSPNDNGGDLVETSYLVQGLLTFRQYLDDAVPVEEALIARINTLWESVEWDWYTRGGQDVLYWHWSPDKEWIMNHQIRGYNESLITYVLAASSATHSISQSVYTNGWAQNGSIENGNEYFGITLPLGPPYGGPLFFAHYSFLGLDPRNLEDADASYWTQNVNHSLINRAYCTDNPKNFAVYSDVCWGLTASDNHEGYSAHSPTNDLGVITPTAALSSFPYTPDESMEALKFFYYSLGDRTWGDYGFYDAFNSTEGWYADSYLAIDQGPIIVMIENYRTGLLWDLFMSCPEVQDGLTKLGFTY